jgi:hypothetical protein
MSVKVNSVDAAARNKVREAVTAGLLLYVTKVKLLVALPGATEWTELHLGYLALSSTPQHVCHFTLVDSDDFSVLMIHELYTGFAKSYTKLTPTIYSFPSDACLLAFQFLKESEAKELDGQIHAAASGGKVKPSLFSFASRRAKSKGAVVSIPVMESEKESRVEWDPEAGYRVSGSFSELPDQHQQFMFEQGYVADKQ